MRSRSIFCIVIASITGMGLAGCLAEEGRDGPVRSEPVVTFGWSAPRPVDAERHGYEPRILVGPKGTLYATAHKVGNPEPTGEQSSWLRYSMDDGETWNDAPSPLGLHGRFVGIEGDIAIDATGRLYFIDTSGAEMALHVFDVSDGTPAWESSRIVGTAAVDDRPWLTAQGDGSLYLLVNNGAEVIAPENQEPARIWLLRSTDGGATWTAGYGFPRSDWCTLDAAQETDGEVAVVCSRMKEAPSATLVVTGPGPTEGVIYRTSDRGATWEETVLFDLPLGFSYGFPSVAIGPDGTVHTAWVEGGADHARDLRVASLHGADDPQIRSFAPIVGDLAMGWLSAGEDGTLAIVCYGRPDAPTQGMAAGAWYPYVMAWNETFAAPPGWSGPVTTTPATTEPEPPVDFLAHDVGPNGTVHVVWEEELPGADPVWAVGDVWYASGAWR